MSYWNEQVPAPVYKTEIAGRENPLGWPRDNLYLQKLALSKVAATRSV
jgi:hypothetical protein